MPAAPIAARLRRRPGGSGARCRPGAAVNRADQPGQNPLFRSDTRSARRAHSGRASSTDPSGAESAAAGGVGGREPLLLRVGRPDGQGGLGQHRPARFVSPRDARLAVPRPVRDPRQPGLPLALRGGPPGLASRHPVGRRAVQPLRPPDHVVDGQTAAGQGATSSGSTHPRGPPHRPARSYPRRGPRSRERRKITYGSTPRFRFHKLTERAAECHCSISRSAGWDRPAWPRPALRRRRAPRPGSRPCAARPARRPSGPRTCSAAPPACPAESPTTPRRK